jgi:predicted amidohydrolase
MFGSVSVGFKKKLRELQKDIVIILNFSKNVDTHIIVDDQGNIKARYRKLHLFDVQLANSVIST